MMTYRKTGYSVGDDVGRPRTPNTRAGRLRPDKIARLRTRIREAHDANPDDPVPGILAGIVDLLEDETT